MAIFWRVRFRYVCVSQMCLVCIKCVVCDSNMSCVIRCAYVLSVSCVFCGQMCVSCLVQMCRLWFTCVMRCQCDLCVLDLQERTLPGYHNTVERLGTINYDQIINQHRSRLQAKVTDTGRKSNWLGLRDPMTGSVTQVTNCYLPHRANTSVVQFQIRASPVNFVLPVTDVSIDLRPRVGTWASPQLCR